MYVETLKRISKALVDAPCTALIAGGAVRDIDNGKAFKDIDVFCLYDEEQNPEQLAREFADHLGLRDLVPHAGAVEYQENWNGIHSVWDGRIAVDDGNAWGLATWKDVQLVFQQKSVEEGADDPQLQITNRFDLNICQIALEYDPAIERYYISKSEGYKSDKENGTITLTQHGLDLPVGPKRDKTRVRARRIADKLNFRTDLAWDRREIEERQMQFYQQAVNAPVQVDYEQLIRQQNLMFQRLQERQAALNNQRLVAQYNDAGGLGAWRDIFG